jgi:signal transduction histidine kinase
MNSPDRSRLLCFLPELCQVAADCRCGKGPGTLQDPCPELERQVARHTAERAVSNERIRHETSKRAREQKELWRRARRLEILREIDRAILEGRSPPAIARIGLHHVRRLVPCLGGVVAMLDLEIDEILVLVAEVDGDVKTQEETRLWLSELKWARALVESLKQGQVHLVEDLCAVSQPSSATQALRAWGLRALLNIPLIAEGELIGFLSLGAGRPGPFALDQVDLALEVAQSLATAIQQARLFEEIRLNRERMRQLARKLVSAQEEERRRLSRVLHDEAGQALTALKISLDLIRDELPPILRPLARRVADASTLTETTLAQLRALAQDLRPPALDTVGLNHALEGFCRRFSGRTQIPITYLGEDLPMLSEAVHICLYRFLQEALTNVAKHACADQVNVVLYADEREIRLSVEDDGQGFDRRARLSSPGWPMGIGLLGMQERIESLGGQLDLESHLRQGTRLVAHIPLQED